MNHKNNVALKNKRVPKSSSTVLTIISPKRVNRKTKQKHTQTFTCYKLS